MEFFLIYLYIIALKFSHFAMALAGLAIFFSHENTIQPIAG